MRRNLTTRVRLVEYNTQDLAYFWYNYACKDRLANGGFKQIFVRTPRERREYNTNANFIMKYCALKALFSVVSLTFVCRF